MSGPFHALPTSAGVRLLGCMAVAVAILLDSGVTATTITFSEGGVSSIGTFLNVSAELSTQATDNPLEHPLGSGAQHYLKVTLRSFGAPTVGRADVLSSFYFNLANPVTGERPEDLTLVSGGGFALEVQSHAADTPVSWRPQAWTTSGPGATAASNLMATNPFDEGWQFKAQVPPIAFPSLGFGIGTVGNSQIASFVPTGFSFDGRVVRGHTPADMINLGIFSDGNGDEHFDNIDPNGGLTGARLIHTQAVFVFHTAQDLQSVDDSWVQNNVTFGFGTNPDSVMLPEPGTISMATTAAILALGWRWIRRPARGGSAAASGSSASGG